MPLSFPTGTAMPECFKAYAYYTAPRVITFTPRVCETHIKAQAAIRAKQERNSCTLRDFSPCTGIPTLLNFGGQYTVRVLPSVDGD